MRLLRLNVHAVRNFKEASITPHPQFNLIVGNNGSGKTTLLEAIHLLALGRSFRSRQAQSVISYGSPVLACFGEAIAPNNEQKVTLGIEKGREGNVKCKLQGEVCQRLSDFASVMPTQLITPETFKLLTAGAEERRRYLDWGVFHVEHSFAALCQTYHRALKQRNAALKQVFRQGEEAVLLWDQELVKAGERIALLREVYLASLLPFIQTTCEQWLPSLPIEVVYYPGWKEGTMETALAAARPKDIKWGFTSVGPHRAELEIRVNGFLANQILSRGQQKLLIFALYLAQAQQLWKQQGKKSVFLVDDLASELDAINRAKVLRALKDQGHQVFLTSIESSSLDHEVMAPDYQVFHVEHGVIGA